VYEQGRSHVDVSALRATNRIDPLNDVHCEVLLAFRAPTADKRAVDARLGSGCAPGHD